MTEIVLSPEDRRAKRREYFRKWRAANADQQREYKRKKYLANRAVVIKRSTEWQTVNAAKHRESVLRWQAANIESVRRAKRLNMQNRRASIMTNTAKAPTAKQLKSLLAQPCHYCGDPAQHVDHYIPLARGGAHTLDNLRPACAPCNTSKGAKLPTEWKGRRC